MKVLKSKELWYVVGLVVIVAASIVLFFFPDLIENKYPYSYQNVKYKNERVVSLNSSLSTAESNISRTIEELKMLEIEGKETEIEALKIKEGIDDSEFELDIPSLLIALEQNSILNKVELDILYEQITLVEAEPMGGSQFDEDRDEDREDIDEDREDIDEDREDIDEDVDEDGEDIENDRITIEDGNEPPQDSDEEEGINITAEDVVANAIKIPGIDVTVIPIKISGSYSGVRNYIKYLDKVGMIEPSSAILSSSGDKVGGIIMLNVFHGEVGL